MPGKIRSTSSSTTTSTSGLNRGEGTRQLLYSHHPVTHSVASSSITSRSSLSNHKVIKVKPPADMFIVKALEKILADRDIRKSYNSECKKACEEALSKYSICHMLFAKTRQTIFALLFHLFDFAFHNRNYPRGT